MNVLITGASGMLGSYLLPLLTPGNQLITLQRHDADILCDLEAQVPDLGNRKFDTVLHLAGSCDECDALRVNVEGSRHLLQALEGNPPKEMVYISSWEVYSIDAGENVEENRQLWASSKTGQSKALAENIIKEWCDANGVLLTILRPARMFGKRIKGEMAQMFDDVIHGRYIHIRDNDARLSLVCAFDVAVAIKMLRSIGGTYNITDGVGAKWIELADAMSSNIGLSKRQMFLPAQWGRLAWNIAPWIPAVKSSLSPQVLSRRSKTFTLANEKLCASLPDWHPFPTIEVISRNNKDYPYADY